MQLKLKISLAVAFSIVSLLLGIAIGSVFVAPGDILAILSHHLFGSALPETISSLYSGMIWSIRLPRVIIAFLIGGGLALGGTAMQSILQNPLASAYGLGISSGAGLGVALVLVTGVGGGLASGIFSYFFLPGVGLVFGLATVILAIAIARTIDASLSNHSIILTGMVFSLFINAILTTISSMYPDHAAAILQWQLGNFSLKEWPVIGVFAVVLVLCFFAFFYYHREMDLMTLGTEQAISAGVDLSRIKWILIFVTALLTGTAVAFVGIIGFIDLVAPHIVRRFFGASHRLVLPMSVLFGGSFMVLCDIISRTIASPSTIPIGSVTALLGAPFFIFIYLSGKRRV